MISKNFQVLGDYVYYTSEIHQIVDFTKTKVVIQSTETGKKLEVDNSVRLVEVRDEDFEMKFGNWAFWGKIG